MCDRGLDDDQRLKRIFVSVFSVNFSIIWYNSDGDYMYTILESYQGVLEIERSSFLAYFMPIEDENQARFNLEKIKKANPKARHCCYAYRLKDVQKSSDDGEPKGTAGRPLLELLIKNDYVGVLIVVVRYFGGIKLGAGRLLRTYVDAALQAMNKAQKYIPYSAYRYHISMHPSLYEAMLRVIHELDAEIEDSEFFEEIMLIVSSEKDILEMVQQRFHGQIKITQLSSKQKYRLEKEK